MSESLFMSFFQLVTAALVHDQEMMAKENERLINKLENIKRFIVV